MRLVINAYAKINLFLDIQGTLANGYHSLYMIMQSVSLYDTVTVEPNGSGKITAACSRGDIPAGKKNIAYKAAEAYFDRAGIKDRGVSIYIEKRIPSAAGLAGGSADAAAVIAGLDRIYETSLTERQKLQTALCVGSDVPFCLTGGTKVVENVGDVIAELPALEACYIVLAKPDCSVSTAEAYADFDKAGHIYRPNRVLMLEKAAAGDLEGICENAGNVFEQVVEVIGRVEIKTIMREFGALLYQMSGSGPTVFGIFRSEADAQSCADKLRKICKDVFVCEPVPYGIKF